MSTMTAAIAVTPMESWIAQRLAVPEESLTRASIAQYQLTALQQTVAFARSHSSFYDHRLRGLACDLPRSLDEFASLPLTSPVDLTEHTPGFLCVPQDKVSRIVTLHSSGTGGAPKRVFFTAEDQELALDFFAHGVGAMASRGDRMLIALPGQREGSVGYQLAMGISRAGVVPIPHGFSIDAAQTLAHMEHEGATCIIGLPVQMLALARRDSALAASVFRRLRSIVLCSDHVPDSILKTLRQRFAGEVFQHYGSTEMGLGGGVDCEAHMGYHLRETDLYFEIVSPETGEPLPDGELGEVVFTTLNRRAMPLIRYRTGDLARFLPGPCACGSILRRLEKVRSRRDGLVSLGTFGSISISMLDEALFDVPELLDFKATVFQGEPRRLELAIHAPGAEGAHLDEIVLRALHTIPAIRSARETGGVEVNVVHSPETFSCTGAKRKVEVHA